MPTPAPLALTPCQPTELLTFVLRQPSPTTLIICTSRTDFLSAVLKGTRPQAPETTADDHPAEEASPSADDAILPAAEQDPHPHPTPKHPLLIPSLYQQSRSQHTRLTFIPTVSHLRAYLSAVSTTSPSSLPQPRHSDRTPHHALGADGSVQPHLLLVYGLVGLHRGTSEWSTQGLGTSLAGLVEAGRRNGWWVVVVEEREGDGCEEEQGDGERESEPESDGEGGRDDDGSSDDGGDDGGETGIEDEERAARAERLRQRKREGIWHEGLPILSGSVRRVGAETEYAGRTVEVGMVLRRWFRFGRGEWEDGSYA